MTQLLAVSLVFAAAILHQLASRFPVNERGGIVRFGLYGAWLVALSLALALFHGRERGIAPYFMFLLTWMASGTLVTLLRPIAPRFVLLGVVVALAASALLIARELAS
jgi:hypothetical protein